MNKNTIKITIIVIILVISVVVGFNYFSQGRKLITSKDSEQAVISNTFQNKNADWQTYKNEKYKFSFSYPREVSLSFRDENAKRINTGNYADSVFAHYGDSVRTIFSVMKITDPGIIPLNADNIKRHFGESQSKYMNLDIVQISNIDGYRVFFNNPIDTLSIFYFVEKHNQIFQIQVIKEDDLMGQVFNTFEFIN